MSDSTGARGMRAIGWSLALACALAGSARAAEPEAADVAAPPRPALRWAVSTGFDFSTGDYGDAEKTDVWYVPVSARVDWRQWRFRVTVPYIRVTGPDSSVTSAVDGAVVLASGSGDRQTQQGLGDVIGAVTYRLDPPRRWLPWIDLTARVKFPTASEGKSLGTGEFDETLQLDAMYSFGRLTPFAAVAYRFVGDPEGRDLSNALSTTLGFDWRLERWLSAGVYYGWRQTASRSLGDAHDLVPYASWKIGKHWSIGPYLDFGLSSAAPDFGAGLQLGYRN
jgi:hypothetical protein